MEAPKYPAQNFASAQPSCDMDHSITHTHTHADSCGHTHSHDHAHPHVHASQKAVLNRLARAIGHLESVKRMVESGRDCSEVLIQLSAVRSALGSTAKLILQDHIQHCIVEAVEAGDQQTIDDLCVAIEKFIK